MGDVIDLFPKKDNEECLECGSKLVNLTEQDVMTLGKFFADLRARNPESFKTDQKYVFGMSFYHDSDGAVWMNSPYIGEEGA